MAWRVFPDATSWTIARHNITLDGEKNTFVPSPPTSSRNSLKANRVLGELEDPVTSEARTADDFRTNGHGMGIPPTVIVSNQLNVHPSRLLATLLFRSFSRSPPSAPARFRSNDGQCGSNCRNQAFSQVCAVCSPPSGGFERYRDVARVEVWLRLCLVAVGDHRTSRCDAFH
jgi:hypothetical protein